MNDPLRGSEPWIASRCDTPITDYVLRITHLESGHFDEGDSGFALPGLNNTPTNVLRNLIPAYKGRDIDRYAELFDWEQFTFVFDVTDVEDDPDLDPTWGWPDELISTKNMLESSLLFGISLDFVAGPVTFPSERDNVPLEWRKIIVTNIELEIDTTDPLGGENIIYKVAGDRGTFFFQSYPDELIEGQPRYRVVEWRDVRVGHLAVVESSWGEIKNGWR